MYKALATLLLILSPLSAFAAVAIDTSGTNDGSGTTVTVPLTLNASANMIAACVDAFGGDASHITSVTWNGVALTQSGSKTQGAFNVAAIYKLSSPTTGAHNLVVTTDGTYGGTQLSGMSFTGAGGAVNGFNSTGGSASNSDSISLTTTSETNSIVLDCLTVQGAGNTLTISGGQTSWFSNGNVGGTSRPAAGSRKAGASSVTTSYTSSGGVNDNWAYAAVNISVNAPSTSSFFHYLFSLF